MADNIDDSVQKIIIEQSAEVNNEQNDTLSFLQDGSVDDYCKKVMDTVRQCQKLSNVLQGWQHYADYSGVQFTMTRINKLLHSLVSKIFSHQDIKLNINGYQLLDQFEIIREGNDALLEKISSDVDEAFGVQRNTGIEIIDNTVTTIRGPVNQNSGQGMVLLASRNVQKPQLFFSPPINNSHKEPFIPPIKEKPNSIKPLSILICLTPDGKEYYSHPYIYELEHWCPSEKLFKKKTPITPRPLAQTQLVFVDNEDALKVMVQELKKFSEVAVDVEHHSFRSYQGLTCLIQISTRQKDYIIDPFPTRNHLFLLNEVFTDPKITKVFHGADHDVLWLQRDFGVYIVNMFDTHQAAIVLDYPHRSLAYLLNHFCNVHANKTYQRSDWRIRPIPEDFIMYARQDSHSLLYIYDLLRNELIDKGNELNNLIQATYCRSTELCMKRYEKPIVGPDSFLELYRKSRKTFNNRQLSALQQIYLWRDQKARQEDESVDFVLPKHMMLQMAEILPKEMQGILACCNPIPALVKTDQLTLHQIIRAAREMPLEELPVDAHAEQPTHHDPMNVRDTTDLLSLAVCRHDLSQVEEDPRGLNTLLNPQETLLGDLFSDNPVRVQMKYESSLFGLQKKHLLCKRPNLSLVTKEFMSPFERYKLFMENDESEEEEEQNTRPVSTPQNEQVKQFMALNRTIERPSDNKKTTQEAATDADRLLRLQDHISNLTSNNSADQNEQVKQKFMALNRTMEKPSDNKETTQEAATDAERLLRLQDHISSLTSNDSADPKKNKKKGKKPAKSLKEQAQERWKRKSSEIVDVDDSFSPKKVKSEVNESEQSSVEPYDYASADYSVFKPKNMKKKLPVIHQKFKGKRSNKSTGFKKSGMKSMTYGKNQ